MGSEAGTWMHCRTTSVKNLTTENLTPDNEGNALVQIDVSSYSSGTYFLTINARGTVNHMPVLIQR